MRTALVGGRVIDGRGGPAQPDTTLVIDGDRVVDVSHQREFARRVGEREAAVLDA